MTEHVPELCLQRPPEFSLLSRVTIMEAMGCRDTEATTAWWPESEAMVCVHLKGHENNPVTRWHDAGYSMPRWVT